MTTRKHSFKPPFKRALEQQIKRAGSAAAWARAHGISTSYLSDVRTERRTAGPKIIAAVNQVRYGTVPLTKVGEHLKGTP